jgi:hypothetical protein
MCTGHINGINTYSYQTTLSNMNSHTRAFCKKCKTHSTVHNTAYESPNKRKYNLTKVQILMLDGDGR